MTRATTNTNATSTTMFTTGAIALIALMTIGAIASGVALGQFVFAGVLVAITLFAASFLRPLAHDADEYDAQRHRVTTHVALATIAIALVLLVMTMHAHV